MWRKPLSRYVEFLTDYYSCNLIGKIASPVCGWAHTGDGCVWMSIVPLFLIFLGLFGNEVGIFEIVDAHGATYVLERSCCHTASFFATTS